MVTLAKWISSLQTSILERCDVMEDMLASSNLERRTRLEIYQNAYLLRLAEALEANYPSLYAVFGENEFGSMMLAYLGSENPNTASIRWFGATLCDFLESHPPYDSVPIFSDIARFEWALRHTVDAADAMRCCFEEMTSLDAEGWLNLKIGLHPSVSLVSQRWNAAAIVQAVNHDLSIPDPQPDPSHWLIYRAIDGAGSWRSVAPLEWVALSAASVDISFSSLCEIIATYDISPSDVAQHAATYLRQWVDEGILISPT